MPGRPGEARDRVFGVAGESLRTGGHVLGAGSPKNEVLQSDQKVSYLDHLSLQHVKYEPNCGRDAIKRTVSVGSMSTSGSTNGGGSGDSMASNSSSSINRSSSSTVSGQSKPTCKPSEPPEQTHAHSLN